MSTGERFLTDDELAPTRRGSLRITRELITDWDVLRSRLIELEPVEGWVCTTDAVSRFVPTALSHRVLSAELIVGDERSVHVRYSGGAWELTTLAEEVGGEMIAYEETHLGMISGTRPAYRVWWREVQRDGVPVWTPYAARLYAFEQREHA